MPTTITTDDELAVLLATLGDTPVAVAETLRAKGIKGRPCESSRCPIANWLVTETGAVTVEVDSDIYFRHAGAHGLWIDPTPDAVAEFIRRFDEGDFPDLIDDGDSDDWAEG